MNIPKAELQKAEKKCNLLAEIDESFQYIIDDLERRYAATVCAQIFRPIIGGGAGQKRIILTEGRKAAG